MSALTFYPTNTYGNRVGFSSAVTTLGLTFAGPASWFARVFKVFCIRDGFPPEAFLAL
jgi:hypothetical protein